MKRVTHTGVQGWAIALALHVLVVGGLLALEPPRRDEQRRRPPVQVRLVQRPRPPLPPEPAPLPEPPRPPRRLAARQEPASRRPQPRLERRAERPTPPPPAAPTPPASPRRFKIDLSATVASGGVAVPAAAGASRSDKLGTPSWARESAVSGTGDQGGGSQGPVQAAEVTTPPRLVDKPSEEALRAAYPPAARRDGLEGNVLLKILVSTAGRVESVRIIRGAGNGFDEAALRLVRGFRFQAASKNGRPVSVWIPWAYKFRLNG